MSKKTLLIILDGYGIGDHKKDDAIFNTPTPYMDSLMANYPHSQLQASGEDVGLPAGQMGNSEVGHLNIGGGRVIYQDLVKINRAIADGSFAANPEIKSAFSYARDHNVPIHFMGLTSAGGVHSSLGHLYALCDTAKSYGLEKVYLHCFMDGRDTDPKSGAGFLSEVQAHCEKSAGKIASVIGRYYAMDRDKRWERLKEAYNLLVYGEGRHAEDMVKAVEESYAEGVTDEFIKPIVNDRVDGRIGAGHVVIFFNYRNDRAKELTTVLTQLAAIGTDKYDFIVVNFANGDMVGHTGVYPAIQKAVATLDDCVKQTVEAAREHDYEVIIIADHGNADHAINEDGTPNTAHSLNPVPFIYVGSDKNAKVADGRLADVAPSLLHLMGIEQPADMTGNNLIKD